MILCCTVSYRKKAHSWCAKICTSFLHFGIWLGVVWFAKKGRDFSCSENAILRSLTVFEDVEFTKKRGVIVASEKFNASEY